MTHTKQAEAFLAEGYQMDRETKLRIFADRLHRARIGKGFTQAELARRANMSRDAINQYVKGKTLPGDVQLKKIAQALSLKPEDLIPGSATEPLDRSLDTEQAVLEFLSSSRARIRLNQIVSTSTAIKIMELINSDVTGDRQSDDASAAN